jgi:uncharacterized protein
MPLPKFPRPYVAYILPFGLFMGALGLVGLVESFASEDSALWLREPKYWIYPLQTLLCAGAIIYFWRDYDFGGWKNMGLSIGAGILVLLLWISPQLIGAAPRTDGFNPELFAEDPLLYWGTVIMRFLRLAVIVPFLEEIFWRGFLMRYFIREKFYEIPFGTLTFASFSGVVVLFSFVHSFQDIFGALAAGVVFGWVAIKTKSLGACVVAHAVTNLLLGFYVMGTKQWGFW